MATFHIAATGQTIVADLAFMQSQYSGGYTEVPQVPGAPEASPAWTWLIDIGPFVDRLGSKRFAIEQSTDPFVMSFRHDVDTRRKWIDLQDPRVAGALMYCAGQPVAGVGTIAAPILTEAEVTAVLTTPVTPEENMALRKLYFS